ncbi:MAG TPA: CmcJ/NvfI family oxidoreductase [Stellaceae bacterium]|nr:CmcJ/NvfI family oxidoreductase [Stellaceae bacterium]
MSITAEPIAAETKLPFVEAELTYLGAMTEKPFNYTYGPPTGKPLTNHVYDPHRVRIHDLRAMARPPGLDREGFQIIEQPTACADLYDEQEIRRVYYPECEAAVAAATGASRVIVFDHTLRRRAPIADRTPGVPRQPVTRVHNDYTETSGP